MVAKKTPSTSAATSAPKYDPEKLYAVALARPVTVGRQILSPHHTNRIIGKRLNELAPEDVLDAKEL